MNHLNTSAAGGGYRPSHPDRERSIRQNLPIVKKNRRLFFTSGTFLESQIFPKLPSFSKYHILTTLFASSTSQKYLILLLNKNFIRRERLARSFNVQRLYGKGV
jgi:hypothetical protein